MQSYHSIASSWWRFIEDTLYHIPEPEPRVRTVPMEVICVGLPRSATESLREALMKLGYSHTYHSWDMTLQEPQRCRAWARLARRKWQGDENGDYSALTRQDFDGLLGHCMAVTELPARAFAAELIDAYPEAKVIINYREFDSWFRSMDETLLVGHRSRLPWYLKWFDRDMFWLQTVYADYLLPGIFRSMDSREGFTSIMKARGRRIYNEHYDMVRGKVNPERLLEWTVLDGWEPLCEFLGKKVPEQPFPHVNSKDGGWAERQDEIARNLSLPLLKKAVLKTFGFTAAFFIVSCFIHKLVHRFCWLNLP